ncbi:MAG: hypothetical protein JXA54_11920 [Candidatus Heimdallarchaeota archaeon]|nr:hypothetical protein [Candidatus Heimdallarchaeota archaeon]
MFNQREYNLNEIEYCNFCGAIVESGAQFCNNCGSSLTKVDVNQSKIAQTDITNTQIYHQPTTVYAVKEQEEKDNSGQLSLIFGIMSFFVFPLLSIAAIILGHNSRKKTKSKLGLIGLILGYIVLATIVVVIIWVSIIMFALY